MENLKEWKNVNISGYEEFYEVSSDGEIKSKRSGKIMKQQVDASGYKTISLHLNKKNKAYKVHRLVALAFIPNPNNLPIVNHKDENKKNNRIDNLEWCDYKYNNNYGTKKERISKKMTGENNHFYGKKHSEESKNKMSYVKKGKYSNGDNPSAKKVVCDKKIFNCIKECAEYYGESYGCISRWLRGINKMPQKFIDLGLRYATEEDVKMLNKIEVINE